MWILIVVLIVFGAWAATYQAVVHASLESEVETRGMQASAFEFPPRVVGNRPAATPEVSVIAVRRATSGHEPAPLP